MSGEAIASILVGVLSLLGVVISNIFSNRRIHSDLRTSQAVTDEKITELTREVREHNNFARRMPVVEERIKTLTDEVKALKNKI